jgi:hypothetical protein
MSNKQQTGVEYLVEQLFPKALSVEQYYHIEKAKEIEKEQIEQDELDAKEIIIIKHTEHGGGEQ